MPCQALAVDSGLANLLFVRLEHSLTKDIEQKETSFYLKEINPQIISKINASLKPKKSHGWDCMNNYLLKSLAPVLLPTLTSLVNNSLKKGIYPDVFKTARVIPLYKSGDQKLTSNYRPISLAPVISKVYERVVDYQTRKYLDDNNIIPPCQFGFRPGHQPAHLLQELVNKVTDAKHKKHKVAVIFADFSKAFDSLDYRILLGKMKLLGFQGNALQWFSSYLAERHQQTEVNNIVSEKLKLEVGAPQGSVLGPLLYLIYTFNLPLASKKLLSLCFADDSTFILTAENDEQLTDMLQREISILAQWFKDNLLSLNVQKTKMIDFYGTSTGDIKINGITIEKVDNYKLLGVNINKNMLWETHAQKVASKIRPAIY